MPRAPRVWFPGAWYHVIARGNNKEAVFFATRDYLVYLTMLKGGLARYESSLHAYVLMPNHVHLLIETGQRHPLPQLMQWLHTTYTCYVNRKHKRVGHLFQGRYRSLLVDRDPYLLELSRYIHLNPVRAHMVDDPSAYRWSSYHAYVHSPAAPQAPVTTQFILSMISPRLSEQVALYRQFVLDGVRPQSGVLENSPLGV